MATDVIGEMIGQATIAVAPLLFVAVKTQIDHITKIKIDYDHITDYWENYKPADTGNQITIRGSLSNYAPMLVGAPRAKRELHLAYRRSIPKKDYENIKTIIDANLAFTAGQMVWRFDPDDIDYVYLGLYQSIVRNSIPVFMTKEYYADKVKGYFSEARSRHVIDATVTGQLQQIPTSLFQEYITKHQLKGYIKPGVLEYGKHILALFVDGKKTAVHFHGDSRYLDGDIWVAVESKGQQYFVSRFLDLADPIDMYRETESLKKDVEMYFPDGNIIFQFDQYEKLIGGVQTITVDEMKKQIFQDD